MECKECYSDRNRATPLLGAKECLEKHLQYICGTCGRCICMNKNTKGLQRWNFPFKSLGVAKLYLRTAEYINEKCLKIYEMENLNGRKFYKMFVSNTDLGTYLRKNKDKVSKIKIAFISEKYKEFANTQVRKLTYDEVKRYMSEI